MFIISLSVYFYLTIDEEKRQGDFTFIELFENVPYTISHHDGKAYSEQSVNAIQSTYGIHDHL